MKIGWGRRIVALLVAGFAGGGVLAVASVLQSAAGYAGGLVDGRRLLDHLAMTPIWVIVFVPTYLVGLAILGLPAWLIVEKVGVRSRAAAVLGGAVLSAATAVVLLAASGDAPESLAWAATLLALSGAAAGWTLHRVAYGSTP